MKTSKKVDRFKLTTLVILVLVASALLFGIGYWARIQIPITNSYLTDQTAATSISTSTTPATTGWKTYTNDSHGFSFKYPNGWIVQVTQNSQDDQVFGLSLTSPDMQKAISEQRPDAAPEILINEFSVPTNFNLESHITENVSYQKDSLSQKTIADQNGYEAIYSGMVDFTYDFWSKKGFYFEASTFAPKSDFDQVLSTFQFTK